MKKAFVVAFVLLIAVFGVAYFYFTNLAQGTRQTGEALSGIPKNTLLLISFKNDATFYEIFKNYKPFEALAGKSKTKEVLTLRNALFTKPNIFRIFSDGQIYASLHPQKESTELLWLITMNEDFKKAEILQELSSAGSIIPTKDYYILQLQSERKKFYFSVETGLVIGSFSEELLKASINKNTLKVSENFVAEISRQSLKIGSSPLDLFVDHAWLPQIASTLFNDKNLPSSGFFKSIKGISSLSMNFKSDAIMFNGLSSIDTGLNNYLSIFLHQKPETNTLKKIITRNTAIVLNFTISDVKLFSKDLKLLLHRRKQLKTLENQLQNIADKTGINAEKDLRKHFGKEFALIQLSNLERIVVMKLKNGSEVNFNLQNISTPYSDYIRRMDYSNIFYYFYGDPLKEFTRPFFSVIDNYLIASNSALAVKQFYNDYVKGDFLIADSTFLNFNQYLANQSNILYFAHNKNSHFWRKKYLKKGFYPDREKDAGNLKNFYGISFQLSADKDHFFTNFYAGYTTQ